MRMPGFSKLGATSHPIAVLLATGIGVGLWTPAPGTVASVVWGLPFAWLVAQLPGIGWQGLAVAAAVLCGVPLTSLANRGLGIQKDHPAIVWDEIASLPIAFLLVPLTNWRIAVAGLVLFRLFDIVKPPPARQLERLPAGWGIMADDVVAAMFAGLALWGLARLDAYAGWIFVSTTG